MIRGQIREHVAAKEGIYIWLVNGWSYVGMATNLYERLEAHTRPFFNPYAIDDEAKYQKVRELIDKDQQTGKTTTFSIWVFYIESKYHNYFETRFVSCLPYLSLNIRKTGRDGRKEFEVCEEYESVLLDFAAKTKNFEVLNKKAMEVAAQETVAPEKSVRYGKGVRTETPKHEPLNPYAQMSYIPVVAIPKEDKEPDWSFDDLDSIRIHQAWQKRQKKKSKKTL